MGLGNKVTAELIGDVSREDADIDRKQSSFVVRPPRMFKACGFSGV